jgi:hypothetical protein
MMKIEELKEELSIELESMDIVVKELLSLIKDISDREPTIREKTAAAGFLAQFYTGLENILKRISRFYEVPLPVGDTWHIELFRRFCSPPYPPLPLLFDDDLASALGPFRRFRHVVHHGYGFQIDWDRMQEGIFQIEDIFLRVKSILFAYLKSLEPLNPKD